MKDVELDDVAELKALQDEKDLYATLTMKDEYLAAQREILKTVYQLNDEEIQHLEKFAYKEALKETDKKTYQAMEGFIHNLNTMHSRAGARFLLKY